MKFKFLPKLIVCFGLISLSNNLFAEPCFKTTAEATTAAKKIGFEKTNYYSSGQAVYMATASAKTLFKDVKYISPDVTCHNGGAWKGAKTVEKLGSRTTRSGTYNKDLTKRIGD